MNSWTINLYQNMYVLQEKGESFSISIQGKGEDIAVKIAAPVHLQASANHRRHDHQGGSGRGRGVRGHARVLSLMPLRRTERRTPALYVRCRFAERKASPLATLAGHHHRGRRA